VDSNNTAGRHKLGPHDQSGDVDRDGEIVDLAEILLQRAREAESRERLWGAMCAESPIDVDEHLARVQGELDRIRYANPVEATDELPS